MNADLMITIVFVLLAVTMFLAFGLVIRHSVLHEQERAKPPDETARRPDERV